MGSSRRLPCDFAAFGLGKSVMQIEALRLIHAHAGGKVLVICPLGVRQEFKRDAQMLNVQLSSSAANQR